MADYNRVILAGNLTRDPELRYTSGNTAVCNFGMAVNRHWTDQSGQRQEKTTFMDITAWGRQAEVLSEYMSKGRPLLVEGRLELDQWENQQGEKRSKLYVVVENFQFLGGRGDGPPGGGGGGGGGRGAYDGGAPQGGPARSGDQGGQGGGPELDDDIPF